MTRVTRSSTQRPTSPIREDGRRLQDEAKILSNTISHDAKLCSTTLFSLDRQTRVFLETVISICSTLCSKRVLCRLGYSKHVLSRRDWSQAGLGVVLNQHSEDGDICDDEGVLRFLRTSFQSLFTKPKTECIDVLWDTSGWEGKFTRCFQEGLLCCAVLLQIVSGLSQDCINTMDNVESIGFRILCFFFFGDSTWEMTLLEW